MKYPTYVYEFIRDVYKNVKHPDIRVEFDKLITDDRMRAVYESDLSGDEICGLFYCCIYARSFDFQEEKETLECVVDEDKRIVQLAGKLHSLVKKRAFTDIYTAPVIYKKIYPLLEELASEAFLNPVPVNPSGYIAAGMRSRKKSKKASVLRALHERLINSGIPITPGLKSAAATILTVLSDGEDKYSSKEITITFQRSNNS